MKNLFDLSSNDENDIISLILDDHKILKNYVKILKDKDKGYQEKQTAFGEFSVLLEVHSKPEEQSLYAEMLRNKETVQNAREGEIEHTLADKLVAELKLTNNEEEWMAKAKVLAELVEHHINEEEDEHLPEFKNNSTEELRIKVGNQFIELKHNMNKINPNLWNRQQDRHETIH